MCNHAKSTSYQAERILFLSIMRIVAPSGLRLSSQPAHAPQADAQGGEIVQRGRGGGRQNTGHTKGNQGAVEADNEAVVGVDARHQRHGDPAQLYQFPETVGSDGDVRDFPGDGGPVADGDARIRLGQGRRVVDAVAHHQDSMSLPAQPGHIVRLIRRQYLGAKRVYPHLQGDGLGGAAAVSGKHDGTGDPQGAEGG